MRTCLFLALLSVVAVGLVAQVSVQEQPRKAPPREETPVAVDANAHAFIQVLVGQVGNPNPRIRFAVREALVTMGHQAVPALQEAREATRNEPVRAFIDRTLGRIKKLAKRHGSAGRLYSLFASRGRDIDRIAMDLSLTFEQMAKLGPIFKKYDKSVKELYAEMRESGAFGDMEAWKDLQEEMKLLAQDTEPQLEDLLGEKKAKRAMRYLRSGAAFAGVPMMFGEGGDVQIFSGPEGTMGVRVIKRSKGGDK